MQDIQRRNRVACLVVVGHRPGSARLQRQPRLRSLQGLNLALLINTKHEGLVRRIHVASFPVAEYRLEMKLTDKASGKTLTYDANFTVET